MLPMCSSRLICPGKWGEKFTLTAAEALLLLVKKFKNFDIGHVILASAV